MKASGIVRMPSVIAGTAMKPIEASANNPMPNVFIAAGPASAATDPRQGADAGHDQPQHDADGEPGAHALGDRGPELSAAQHDRNQQRADECDIARRVSAERTVRPRRRLAARHQRTDHG